MKLSSWLANKVSKLYQLDWIYPLSKTVAACFLKQILFLVQRAASI
jgi:hypothetical protein